MSVEISEPLDVSRPDECTWYHAFTMPDGSYVHGRWDYSPNVEDYIGRQDFAGKSVIELGPASGYLTRAMEKRGADVLCIDVNVNQGWDVVPRLDRDHQQYIEQRKNGIHRLWKSWWLTRKLFNGTAQISYSGAESISALKGNRHFDIGFVGSILVHFENPYIVLSRLAELCDTIVITEAYTKRLDYPGRAVMEFLPAVTNNNLGSWWLLSERVVEQMMATLNFAKSNSYYADYKRWDMKTRDPKSDTFTAHKLFTHIYKRTARDASKFGSLLET